MSTLDSVVEQVKGAVQDFSEKAKVAVLGANNERLDFLMDSFYKLNPQQRNLALGGAIGSVLLLVVTIFAIYFSQLGRLKSDLNESFKALHELSRLGSTYQAEKGRYEKFQSSIRRKTQSLRMKPFLEKIANQQGVVLEGLSEQRSAFAADNPLASSMQKINLDLSLPKISIPKLMNFMVEIEKSNKFLQVENLTIRGRYGTKLFFTANAKIRGYQVTGN